MLANTFFYVLDRFANRFELIRLIIDVDVEFFFNSLAQNRHLSDAQVKTCLRKAMKDAMELHDVPKKGDDDEPGESPRNTRARGSTGTARRRAPRSPAATPKAESYAIEKSPIRREDNPAPSIREMIRGKALKKALKDGKTDADAKKYADDQADNFEKAIA